MSSINQWKLLVQLKDTLAKLSNDKYLQNVFSKDFIPKMPSTNELVKSWEQFRTNSQEDNTTATPKTSSSSSNSADQQQEVDKSISSYYNLPNVLQNLKSRSVVAAREEKLEVSRKWKKREVSVYTISSQTQHAISALETAETEDALLQRLEGFISHIAQSPEARNSAIKFLELYRHYQYRNVIQDGVIRLLLKIRSKTAHNENIQGGVREALARLGYSDPVPGRGIRILSMDGGGIRGLLVLEMLKKLEELTGKKTHELFDLFCGVSTGAILSFSIAIHRKDLDEIAKVYKDISNMVFNQNPITGSSNLVFNQAYYDTALWQSQLKLRLGTDKLISTSRDPLCPKLCAVSAVVNQSRLSAFVFRNYSLPWRVKSQYFGSCEYEVWEAATASAAAPTYFEEFRLGNFIHQDGGILINNPTGVAIHEAKLIWPNTPIQCVISCGTGRSVPTPAESYHNGNNNNTSGSRNKRAPAKKDGATSTSWANKFYKLLDSATDTEGVHMMLNDLLPDEVYYRFNPYLTEFVSMVEINKDKIEQMERDALMYLRRNEEKFQEAARCLSQQKTSAQKVREYVNRKRDLYGF